MGRDAVERRRRSRPWHPHGQVVQYSVPDLVDLLGAEELAEDLRRLAELGQADAGSAAAAWSDPRQASSDISPGEPKHGNYI